MGSLTTFRRTITVVALALAVGAVLCRRLLPVATRRPGGSKHHG